MEHTPVEFAVVITTCANTEDAEAIIAPLLRDQLVACVQVSSIVSHYTWKGAVAQETEQLLFMKCLARLYPKIEESIRAHHKYETPEIVQLPILAGAQSYLSWIKEVSRP